MKKAISRVKISYCRCSKWNHKISFQHLKQNLISNNTSNNTNSVKPCSTNLVNVINVNYVPNTPNISNLNSQNLISYSNTKKFSLCFNWNTNGWNFVKEIVLSASTRFLNHYSYVFRKITFPNYKYFQKRVNPNVPVAEVYILYQTVLKDNSYTHLISLTT